MTPELIHSTDPSGQQSRQRLERGPQPFLASRLGEVGLAGPPNQDALATLFPPIADYAFLSDCENSCLVAPTGSIEWLCLPKPHDPSVFGTILDRAAGSFRLAPVDSAVPAHRQYVPGTMVLATTWQTRSGWLVVTDFLAVAPWYRKGDRSELHRRTPGDFDARHILVRSAAACTAPSTSCSTASLRSTTVAATPSGSTRGRPTSRWRRPTRLRPRLTLTGDMRFGIEGRAVRARHRLTEGESSFVVLSWTDGAPPSTTRAEVESCRAETSRFWRDWIDGGTFPDHPWRELLQRSALTLKGLTYAPTGALLAAPTTSLPEQPGGQRNWDYRYTWIRDAAFTLRALHALGFDTEADDFLAFLGDVLEPQGARPARTTQLRGNLQVLYPVDGATRAPESELDHLTGYAGQPARAHRQRRLQPGPVRHPRRDRGLRLRAHPVARLAERARRGASSSRRSRRHCSRWQRAGPRHLGDPRRTPALHVLQGHVLGRRRPRRAPRRAARREGTGASEWWSAAQEIHADICANALGDNGLLHASPTVGRARRVAPAAAACCGFLPAQDERIRATVLAIADELSDGAFVYRYRTESDRRRTRGSARGQLHRVLVLARLGARRDRRARSGAHAVREVDRGRQHARALRRGDRPDHCAAPRQLPPGVDAPLAHQRRAARHRGRTTNKGRVNRSRGFAELVDAAGKHDRPSTVS